MEENKHTKNEDVVEEYGKYYERIKQQYEENYPEGGYDFETYVMDEAFNERSEHIKTVKQRNEAWKKNEILYNRFRQSKQDNKTNRDRLKSLAIDNLRILFLDYKKRITTLIENPKVFVTVALREMTDELALIDDELSDKNGITVSTVINLSNMLACQLLFLNEDTELSECIDNVKRAFDLTFEI